jgi:MscS family membrane protein
MTNLLLKPEVILTLVLLVSTFVVHRFIIWSAAKLSERVSRSELRKQYLKRYTG